MSLASRVIASMVLLLLLGFSIAISANYFNIGILDIDNASIKQTLNKADLKVKGVVKDIINHIR